MQIFKQLHIPKVLYTYIFILYVLSYTVVIKKVVPTKYGNISVTRVISLHQHAWCSFIKCQICIARRKS